MQLESKVATAIRLNAYFANIHISLSFWKNLHLYLIGIFYILFLPRGIGGNRYKVYLLNTQFKSQVKELLKASLLDRLGGLIAILALLFRILLLIDLPLPIGEPWVSKEVFSVGAIGIIPGFWLLKNFLFSNFLPSFWQGIFWSLDGQLGHLAALVCLLLALGVQEKFLAYLAVFLLFSIVAGLPLTIARELVVV